MLKMILAAAAVASVAIAAPALAQVERHQNPSLNGYVGFATDAQYAQPTALGSGAAGASIEAVGSGNPSLESFNPNAVSEQPEIGRASCRESGEVSVGAAAGSRKL